MTPWVMDNKCCLSVFIHSFFLLSQICFWCKNIRELKDFFTFKNKFNKFFYNVVWVQYKSPQLKKNENQNKSLKNEWLVFALRNVVSNEYLLILFHYLMFINYHGNIYQNTLSMESPIIHD
jgi:hypothetical protein